MQHSWGRTWRGHPTPQWTFHVLKAATCLGSFFSRTWRSQGEGGGSSEFLDFSGSYAMVRGCWDIPVSAGHSPPNPVGVHRHQKMCLCNNKGVSGYLRPLPLHVRILKGVENYSVGLIDFGFRILGTTWVIDTRTLSTKMAPQERLYAFCSVYPFWLHPAILQVRSYVWA